MKQTTTNAVVGAAAMSAGLVTGVVVEKVVAKKLPQLQPVLLWTSGLLVGIGATALLAPNIISKSEAASILASS